MPRLTNNLADKGGLVEERGAWPFISRRVWQTAEGDTRVWSSRHHRKDLILREAGAGVARLSLLLRSAHIVRRLNWWIGSLFAVGASLFAIGSVLSLSPALATMLSVSAAATNAIFFAGSIPFTTAAYLQLWQSANVKDIPGEKPRPHARMRLFDWRPGDVGWLSCALQFIGTVLFNIDTFDAMNSSLNWIEQDLLVWLPNLFGSILFLASGYLAFIETCHRHWAWQPRSLTWWLVFANLMGCLAFMASALTAMILPGAMPPGMLSVSVAGTLTGALCFLAGALLTLVETALNEEEIAKPGGQAAQ